MALTMLAIAIMLPFSFLHQVGATCTGRNPVVFNFGDSNSDTGGVVAGLGYRFPLPEGRVFFHRGTGRLCDGRLVIDFLCESLNTTYLSPYLEALNSNFSNGANFAISGSSTLPRNVPFALFIQIEQFLHFKSRSLDLIDQGVTGLFGEEAFRNALYTMDIGQNDLSGAFSGPNGGYQQALERIPLVIAEIKSSIKTLYDNGARKFWVHNTGPLGCLPQKLALPRKDDTDLDAYGCLSSYNKGAGEFNRQLSTLVDALNSELKDATIVYTDIFSIKYDIIANYTKYGFENPLMACCGYGGPPYNYNQGIMCLGTGYSVCTDGSKYVSWDGVHYTEAANHIVASKILSADYSKPRLNFDFFCQS
ncbi:GDSL esterase/lipase LIP-4-like [Carex rostrata]